MKRFAWHWTLGIAITLLGGCAAVATRPDAAVVETPASRDARIQQAAELVQAGASLSGAARTANDAQ
ncbi:MAG: hypothetical protein ACREPE_16505, partial [Lysobacter sp.]